MSSPSTTISPAATPNGWARSTSSSACPSASSSTASTTSSAAAYACDITYGTNNEFGFDYLRDNMKYELAQMVQRGHTYAIVDEVDSILVDEARTPLIISGPLDDRSDSTSRSTSCIPQLDEEISRSTRSSAPSTLTEAGTEKIERAAARRRPAQGRLALRRRERHHRAPRQSGAARPQLFQRDKDYIVRNGEVVIIDEFTGRMMPGRRYSEGLHQALEAKEHVSRSSRRTRRSRRSPSRTISACTRSSPA